MAETTTTSSSPYSIGRVTDYLLGRNALIGVASFMLLIISGYATWHGMRDFIIGVSATPTSQGQQLPGGMSISNDVLVIVVVVALTFLMWLMLRETFGRQARTCASGSSPFRSTCSSRSGRSASATASGGA